MNLSLRLVIILLCIQPVFAGITTKDSLLSILSQKEGSDKIVLYTQLVRTFQWSNPDSSLKWAQSGFVLSQQKKDMWGMALYLYLMGESWQRKGNYQKAEAAHKQSFKLSAMLEEGVLIADNLHALGQVQMSWGNYAKSLEYHLQSLTLRQQQGNEQNIALSLTHIGLIYNTQMQYGKAVRYHMRALNQLKNTPGSEWVRAVVRMNLGNVYEKKRNYSQALLLYQQVYPVFMNHPDRRIFHSCLLRLAAVYREQNQYTLALSYYTEAINLARTLQQNDILSHTMIGMAKTYARMNQLRQSITWAEQALSLANECQAKPFSKQACMVLYQNCKNIQDYSKALFYFEQAQKIEDSMMTVGNTDVISTIEAKYRLEQQQTEMASLQQSTQKILSNYSRQSYLFMGIIVTVAIIIFLLLRHYQQEKKIEQLLVKQKISELAYLNAHKIRGPVASILGLVSLFNRENLSDSFNKAVIDYIHTAATNLDNMIHEVANKTQFMYQMHELGAGELVYHKHKEIKG